MDGDTSDWVHTACVTNNGAFLANAFDRDTCYIGAGGGEIW